MEAEFDIVFGLWQPQLIGRGRIEASGKRPLSSSSSSSSSSLSSSARRKRKAMGRHSGLEKSTNELVGKGRIETFEFANGD